MREKDMGGPKWSRERVDVPAILIGEVSRTARGVAFEEQMVERVPCEASDVPLRMVITNERSVPVEAC